MAGITSRKNLKILWFVLGLTLGFVAWNILGFLGTPLLQKLFWTVLIFVGGASGLVLSIGYLEYEYDLYRSAKKDSTKSLYLEGSEPSKFKFYSIKGFVVSLFLSSILMGIFMTTLAASVGALTEVNALSIFGNGVEIGAGIVVFFYYGWKSFRDLSEGGHLKSIELSRTLNIFIVFKKLIGGSLWISLYARRGLLTLENILIVFGGMLVINVVTVPFMIWSDNRRRAFYQPSKPQKPRAIPSTLNKTVLEAEHHWLVDVHLEDIQNLHELTRINLGLNQIKSIDLSPLAGSTNLKELILYMNKLETIDLSPLASCPNLEYLDLTDNKLESIDLTPLSSCLKLTGLNIGINRTGQLDLSPISDCKEMEVLNVDGMNLREIDLSPLRNFTKLWFLKLDDNELTSLDITPLFECVSLTDFQIDKIELTSILSRPIEEWPEGVKKHKKRFRES